MISGIIDSRLHTFTSMLCFTAVNRVVRCKNVLNTMSIIWYKTSVNMPRIAFLLMSVLHWLHLYLMRFCVGAPARTTSTKSKFEEVLIYRTIMEMNCLEIINNIAERSIKPFVIDRKIFLLPNTTPNTTNGATVNAVTLNAIQIAIASNLNPSDLFFTEVSKMTADSENWLGAMQPHNASESCKGVKKQRNQN